MDDVRRLDRWHFNDAGEGWIDDLSYEGVAFLGSPIEGTDTNAYTQVGGISLTDSDIWGSDPTSWRAGGVDEHAARYLSAAEASFNANGGLVGHWESKRGAAQ